MISPGDIVHTEDEVVMATSVALLGTGNMGAAMARRMRGHGLAVRAWNRTRARAQPLAAAGVEVADTPRAATAGADVIVTMLADGPAVEQAMVGPDGALAGAAAGTVWLQTSTVGIEACRRLGDLAGSSKLAFLDAPVLGTREPAERGELTVLASGPRELEPRVSPIFGAIARKTIWVGEVGAGTRAKLVMNAWVTGLVGVLAETIALAERLGIAPEMFLETVKGGPLDSPYAQLKGRAMIERAFPPSFSLRLAHKDLRLILEAARQSGASLPVLAAVEQIFAQAEKAGHGEEDMAAVVAAVAPR
jgi:3-hydroxyisobutyrate dehydrogenase